MPPIPSLPTELLLAILQFLDEPDLLTLAFLCRRLHYLALPMYLTRNDIRNSENLSSQTLYLHSWQTLSTLPVLSRALFVTSLKRLSCCLFCTISTPVHRWPNTQETSRNTRGLARLLEKVSHVEEIWFDISHITRDDEWCESFMGFLDVMADKRCTSLTVLNSCFTPEPRKRHLAVSILPSRPSFLSRLLRRVKGSKPLTIANGRGAYNSVAPPWPRPLATLATFSISSSLLIHNPFLEWALSTLDLCSKSITALHLKHLHLPRNTPILRVTLSAISDLTVSSLHYFDDLLGFISRHGTIAVLDLRGSTMSGGLWASSQPWNITMPSLTKLSAPPEFIFSLLELANGNEDRFPVLQSIEILPGGFQFGSDTAFDYIDRAFRSLTPLSQRQPIRLSLTLLNKPQTLAWLDISSDRSRDRAERSLMVQFLELHITRFGPINKSTIGNLPGFVALFSAVKHLSFPDLQLEMTMDEVVAFARSIIKACPLIEYIAFGSDNRSTEAWLAMRNDDFSTGAVEL
jgi:hypothetical protein